jgi:L,D-transpeptidase catalytic domain/Putative peptidoglycan binding domain
MPSPSAPQFSPRITSTHRRLLASFVIGVGLVSTFSLPNAANAVGPTLPPGGGSPATTKLVGPPAPPAPSGTAAPTANRAPKRAAKKVASKKAAKTGSKSTSKGGSKGGGLSQGSRGEKVAALQARLMELHYDVTDTEGQYGDQTYHAVLAFQKTNRLNRTGSANSQTLAALESATTPAPMMPNGGTSRVEADLTRQVLLIWENNELYRIVSISSGNGKDFCSLDPETNKTECDVAVTPTGSFRVTRRWVGWRESKLGEMYNPLYFSGGFAIHGSLSVPGYPASHGCIRVPMVSAEWLPSIIEDGTPVYVFGAKDGDKQPTALKYNPAPPTPTTPGATTPGATIPAGGTTKPGPSTTIAPTTVPATTTTTLVRLLGGSTTPAPTVPPTTPSPVTASTTPPVTAPPLPTTPTTTPTVSSSLLPLPVG